MKVFLFILDQWHHLACQQKNKLFIMFPFRRNQCKIALEFIDSNPLFFTRRAMTCLDLIWQDLKLHQIVSVLRKLLQLLWWKNTKSPKTSFPRKMTEKVEVLKGSWSSNWGHIFNNFSILQYILSALSNLLKLFPIFLCCTSMHFQYFNLKSWCTFCLICFSFCSSFPKWFCDTICQQFQKALLPNYARDINLAHPKMKFRQLKCSTEFLSRQNKVLWAFLC